MKVDRADWVRVERRVRQVGDMGLVRPEHWLDLQRGPLSNACTTRHRWENWTTHESTTVGYHRLEEGIREGKEWPLLVEGAEAVDGAGRDVEEQVFACQRSSAPGLFGAVATEVETLFVPSCLTRKLTGPTGGRRVNEEVKSEP